VDTSGWSPRSRPTAPTTEIRAAAVGVLPASVRSLDARHVATAVVAGLQGFASCDARQLLAAEEAGLRPAAPGPGGGAAAHSTMLSIRSLITSMNMTHARRAVSASTGQRVVPTQRSLEIALYLIHAQSPGDRLVGAARAG